MQKTYNSLKKDKIAKDGKIWIRNPYYDIRQASGVTFGGIYLTLNEYIIYQRTNKRSKETSC